jgi:hypothetical protein
MLERGLANFGPLGDGLRYIRTLNSRRRNAALWIGQAPSGRTQFIEAGHREVARRETRYELRGRIMRIQWPYLVIPVSTLDFHEGQVII